MVHITESKLQEFVGQNGGCIGEAKERVVGKDGPQTHCSRMKDRFSAEATKTGMAVYNLNLFANHNVAKNRKE
jgi:hypothetical protein